MSLPPPTSGAAVPPAAGADLMIEMHDVMKSYGEQLALDHIDLEVPRGVIVGLIGPSGCGKTTLVKTLTGIIGPTSGDVRVFGTDPAAFDTATRRRFGYMPQLPVLYQNLSVWGNLNFIASIYGMSLRHRRRRLKQLLELVDLGQHRSKLLAECSGGMQRRLTLAATLVHDPELLFLDEPTAGVDPILRERFWAHFRSLRDNGSTILVPTQYVGEAAACDLVAVMALGRLITVLPPGHLAPFAYGGTPLAVEFRQDWVSGEQLTRLEEQSFVREVTRTDWGVVVVVDDSQGGEREVRSLLESASVSVGEISPLEPSLDEIFVKIVEAHTTDAERAAA
ncbi:MAG: ABC transporter ATP-binding protein [Ilumatobacteraceae bacterium]